MTDSRSTEPRRLRLFRGKLALCAAAALIAAACDPGASTRPSGPAPKDTTTVPANRPPTIEPVEMPQWVIPGVTLRRIIRAIDPDGDALHYSLFAEPVAGFALHDSLAEWTPTPDEASPRSIIAGQVAVADTHGHVVLATLASSVLGYDPRPYAATLQPGRVWRIRGYSKTWSSAGLSQPDSTYTRRAVTLLTADTATGSFSYRVQDTLTGTRHGISDSTYTQVRRMGYDLTGNSPSGLVPFGWPGNPTVADSTRFQIGGQSGPARHEIWANTCLGGSGGSESGTKYGCGGGETAYAAGWGLVSRQWDSQVTFIAQHTTEDYSVWDMADP